MGDGIAFFRASFRWHEECIALVIESTLLIKLNDRSKEKSNEEVAKSHTA